VLKRWGRIFALLALVCAPLAAQKPDPDAVSRVTLQGLALTAEKTPVPGATVRILNAGTQTLLTTWTDESGKFDLRSIPVGKYHIEVTQLGFEKEAEDVELTVGKNGNVQFTLHVATLAAINAAKNPQPSTSNRGNNPGARNQAAANSPPGTPPSSSASRANSSSSQPNQRGGRGGTAAQNGQGGRGSFSPLDVSEQEANADANGTSTGETESSAGSVDTQAQATEAAVFMSGSVGQGSAAGFGGFGGGDFGGQGGLNGDAANGQIPGQTGLPGAGGFGGGAGGGGAGGGGGGGT